MEAAEPSSPLPERIVSQKPLDHIKTPSDDAPDSKRNYVNYETGEVDTEVSRWFEKQMLDEVAHLIKPVQSSPITDKMRQALSEKRNSKAPIPKPETVTVTAKPEPVQPVPAPRTPVPRTPVPRPRPLLPSPFTRFGYRDRPEAIDIASQISAVLSYKAYQVDFSGSHCARIELEAGPGSATPYSLSFMTLRINAIETALLGAEDKIVHHEAWGYYDVKIHEAPTIATCVDAIIAEVDRLNLLIRANAPTSLPKSSDESEDDEELIFGVTPVADITLPEPKAVSLSKSLDHIKTPDSDALKPESLKCVTTTFAPLAAEFKRLDVKEKKQTELPPPKESVPGPPLSTVSGDVTTAYREAFATGREFEQSLKWLPDQGCPDGRLALNLVFRKTDSPETQQDRARVGDFRKPFQDSLPLKELPNSDPRVVFRRERSGLNSRAIRYMLMNVVQFSTMDYVKVTTPVKAKVTTPLDRRNPKPRPKTKTSNSSHRSNGRFRTAGRGRGGKRTDRKD